MRIPLIGACMLFVITLAGCSSDVSLMQDDARRFRQERYIYACEDNQLCGVSRLYDVHWQSIYDYPLDYRVKAYDYTPSKTQYLHQERVVVVHPYSNFYWRAYE